MDKFDFLSVISDLFEGLKTEEEINEQAEAMVQLIRQQTELSKAYLRVGIL